MPAQTMRSGSGTFTFTRRAGAIRAMAAAVTSTIALRPSTNAAPAIAPVAAAVTPETEETSLRRQGRADRSRYEVPNKRHGEVYLGAGRK